VWRQQRWAGNAISGRTSGSGRCREGRSLVEHETGGESGIGMAAAYRSAEQRRVWQRDSGRVRCASAQRQLGGVFLESKKYRK